MKTNRNKRNRVKYKPHRSLIARKREDSHAQPVRRKGVKRNKRQPCKVYKPNGPDGTMVHVETIGE